MMNSTLITALILLSCIICNAQAESVVNKLTDGATKRWIFSKSQLSMGSRIEPMEECPFSTITFKKEKRSYFAIACQDTNKLLGVFTIVFEAPEDHFIIISDRRYEVLFEKVIINQKDKLVLILRDNARSKGDETKEYFYYGE